MNSYAGGKWLNKNGLQTSMGQELKTSSAACIWFGPASSSDKGYLKE